MGGPIDSSLDGLGYRIKRANSAKDILDEIRKVPGSQTQQVPSYAFLLRSASVDSTLEYLAGNSRRSDFERLVQSLDQIISNALQEIMDLDANEFRSGGSSAEQIRALLGDNGQTIISGARQPTSEPNPKVSKRIARAISLLMDANVHS
jgi:hypothetical protein